MSSARAPRLRSLLLAGAIVVAGVSSRVHAQPIYPPPVPDHATEPAKPKPEPEPERSPPAVPPDQVSGVEIAEPTPTGEQLRWIPRTLFFVPRWTFWLAAQPLRLAAWTYEKTQNTLRGALFSTDLSYGVYPVATYSTDFGVSVGIRALHKNLWGAKERLKLFADWGGEFRQGYGFSLTSGERVAKRFTATLEARSQRRPGERFFGIGNGPELEMPPGMPIDPMTSNVAVASRFREDLTRITTHLDTFVVGGLTLRATGAWAKRDFANSDFNGEDIVDRYDTNRLIGFTGGLNNLYLEGEILYDTRRPTNPFISQVMDATGWYVSIYGGHAKGLRDDPTEYSRYGGEVQRVLDLYKGSRTLTLRVLLDGVTGTDGRTDGKISFIDLPRLGGSDILRGYPRDRFRDRVVAEATVEYGWDLGNYFGGYTFCDVGRPFSALGEIEATDLRMGCGLGIEMRTYQTFLFRGQLAASRDGDVFFELALSPAFGRHERAGRF